MANSFAERYAGCQACRALFSCAAGRWDRSVGRSPDLHPRPPGALPVAGPVRLRAFKTPEEFQIHPIARLEGKDSVQFFVAAGQPPLAFVSEGLVQRVLAHHKQKDSARISVEDFSAQNTEFRDRIPAVQHGLGEGNVRQERVGLAQKVFELSQNLMERWVSANYAIKRQILEMLCLNFRLDGVTLVPEWRKPFDLLAEGLFVQSSQGDRI